MGLGSFPVGFGVSSEARQEADQPRSHQSRTSWMCPEFSDEFLSFPP